MFTGIVEGIGRITRLAPAGERIDLAVDVGPLAEDVRVGDSVALNGCCLTVSRVEGSVLWFQAIPETVSLTSLRARSAGDGINVERALRADARLGGHLVQGHVDATGTVSECARQGEDVRLRIECAAALGSQLIPKGSIAVDGVSLTVVSPEATGFEVALIPHTLASTTLGEREPGDPVNLELDVLGKYVHRYVEQLGLGRDPRPDS